MLISLNPYARIDNLYQASDCLAPAPIPTPAPNTTPTPTLTPT